MNTRIDQEIVGLGGVKKLMLKLSGISYGFMLNNVGDTLWIQEDRRIYLPVLKD